MEFRSCVDDTRTVTRVVNHPTPVSHSSVPIKNPKKKPVMSSIPVQLFFLFSKINYVLIVTCHLVCTDFKSSL